MGGEHNIKVIAVGNQKGGVGKTTNTVHIAQARGNPGLVLLGVVISGVDRRTRLANTLSDFVEQTFRAGENSASIKFKATIGRSTVIPQTQKVGKTLFETHSTHKVTDEYRSLALEIEDRLSKLESLVDTERNVVNG